MRCGWALGLAWALVGLSAAGQTAGKPVWVERTGTGASVRAIVPVAEDCPVAMAGGKKLTLKAREGTVWVGKAFPVKACAADVPGSVAEVRIEGKALKVRAGVEDGPRRIVVIGDTGCRQTEKEMQDCDSDWPFAKIAGFAAARKPDLVIHVGDYYYREICPKGEKHCENWANWDKDFFEPGASLLEAAPWIMARGNHEMCGRAAEGWFRFLDAGETPLACITGDAPAEAAAFAVKMRGLTVVAVDSADIEDTMAVDKKMTRFASRIAGAGVGTQPKEAVWVLTHKPAYEGGLLGKASDVETGEEPPLNNVDLFLTGHVHMFSAVDFKGVRPAELVVGDSGTALNGSALKIEKAEEKEDPAGLAQMDGEVDGKAAHLSVKGRFGYMLLERKTAAAREWTGTLYGVSDEVLATCSLKGRDVSCVAPEGVGGSRVAAGVGASR